MNVSHDWLKAFVPNDLTPAQLRDLITARVATVDELVPLRADLAPFVVARVVEAAPHPDSDHLWVTKVDAGDGELLDVVCGAPNVQAGKLYPFARTGTVMPGGLKIERRKIRGQLSNGMLCSARELGLGENHEGILELDVDVPPGTPFIQAVPVGDTRLVIDVLPNRPDLLSHLGVAREVAAALGGRMHLPALPGLDAEVPPPSRAAASGRAGTIGVEVEHTELAPRYMGVVIRGVQVGPSPEWLVRRLESVGSRSINNVVDATNYVLHELGQPTHAFDLSKLDGGRVVVRRARAGEKLVTLDGVERALQPSMTVIADATHPQAVAGVMGGAASEVTAATTDVFLEVAVFDPRLTRATRRALGLSTEASYRFERGVDITLPPIALDRLTKLIISLAGGRVEGLPVDLCAVLPTPAPLTLRVDRVRRLLGEAIPASEIGQLLHGIGFIVSLVPGTEMLTGREELRVVVPAWRSDVTAEVDLIEEVARLHGYDRFPDALRPYRVGNVPDHPLWGVSRRVRESLVAAGLLETRPMPFVRGAEASHARVANPLAEDEAFLRRSLMETLARRAEHNLAHMQRVVRLFEVGSVFHPQGEALPREELRAAAIVLGSRHPAHFTEPRPPHFDEWDAKWLGELVARAGHPGSEVALVPAEDGGADGLLWTVQVDGERLGEVRRVALDAPVWAAPAYGVEVTLGSMPSSPVAEPGRSAVDRAAAPAAPGARARRYRPLPTTPAAEFDLALLVPEAVPAARVEEVLRSESGELLEELQLFDEFRGSGVPAGYRSLAWRLTFRHPERTLRDKEVEGRRSKLLRTLENQLGVRQRAS